MTSNDEGFCPVESDGDKPIACSFPDARLLYDSHSLKLIENMPIHGEDRKW